MTHSQAEIERRAQEVLSTAGALSVPVDVEKVVASLGARLHLQQFEDHVSGVLAVRADEKHILVNAGHHPNRQRFTAAHEIGHLVLHHRDGDQLFIDRQLRVYQRIGPASDKAYSDPGSTTSWQEEREANLFASALLMPRALVTDKIGDTEVVDELDVTRLALAFGVSEQAMSIRLQALKMLAI